MVNEEDWPNSVLAWNMTKFQKWHHIVWGPDIFMIFFSSSRYCGIVCVCLHKHTHTQNQRFCRDKWKLHVIWHKYSQHKKCNNEQRWILEAAIRSNFSRPVVCFRTWHPILWSKCDHHVFWLYKKVLENERMKFSSSTSVAQIAQNYFIRLLFLVNFQLVNNLMVPHSVLQLQSVHHCMQ